MPERAPFFYGVKILGDIGIFDEYCRLIEYNNDNSQDYVQIHYENNGSPDTLGIENPAGLYPRTGGYLRGGTRETAPCRDAITRDDVMAESEWAQKLRDYIFEARG